MGAFEGVDELLVVEGSEVFEGFVVLLGCLVSVGRCCGVFCSCLEIEVVVLAPYSG